MPDRKKVLHELDHQLADADWCDNDWKDNVPIWMLRGALALLKEQDTGGWISVKDRLPGNEFVLVSVVTKNAGHRWETPTIGEIVHGKWFLETEGTIADNVGVTVTHWMSLPEPPKEDDGK